MQVHAQFDLFRTHNKALGLPFDEHMCFGLTVGDGSKKSAKLCAKLCNGWITNMRRHGIEKIAVLSWSHRFGPLLTIPMLIDADIRLARTSGYNRRFGRHFCEQRTKSQMVASEHGLNVVMQPASTLFTCWLTMASSSCFLMNYRDCLSRVLKYGYRVIALQSRSTLGKLLPINGR